MEIPVRKVGKSLFSKIFLAFNIISLSVHMICSYALLSTILHVELELLALKLAVLINIFCTLRNLVTYHR